MALKINYKDTQNAYLVVDVVSGNKTQAQLVATVFDSQDRMEVIETVILTMPIDTGENSLNFIKQGYIYLKSLDSFKNAIDA